MTILSRMSPRAHKALMVKRTKFLGHALCPLRVYSTTENGLLPEAPFSPNTYARSFKRTAPSDPHAKMLNRYIGKKLIEERPLLKRMPDMLRRQIQVERSKVEIEWKALQICKQWPVADALAPAKVTSTECGPKPYDQVTYMTTNFVMYIPRHVRLRDPETGKLDHLKISRYMRILLLKRGPDVRPFPNAWSAISGRLEKTNNGTLEYPIDGALREFKEEINFDPGILELETALQPTIVVSPGDKKWRTWPMLWRYCSTLSLPGLEQGNWDGLSGLERRQKIASISRQVITLNDENVEFRWQKYESINAVPGLVPGLSDTLRQLITQWIRLENSGLSEVSKMQAIRDQSLEANEEESLEKDEEQGSEIDKEIDMKAKESAI